MKIRVLLTLVLLMLFTFGSDLYAQEPDKFEVYNQELKLSEDQKKELYSIISSCDEELAEIGEDDLNTKNRILKIEISKIYHLLTKEQFKKFKELRNKLEGNKIPRVN